jgi:putative ABC transport system permease protein
MLRNYLAAAIRNLFRNRAYAVINIFGLALGFSAAILIALYVRDEYSFDKQFPNGDRIYRVQSTVSFPGRPTTAGSVVASNIAEAMEIDFPQVEAATRLCVSMVVLRHGDVRSQMLVHWADPDFFELFPMQTIAGTLTNALASPDGIVLTRDAARRFFGTEDVVGQTLDLNDHPMRVTAVLENLPSNTHFDVEVFAPGVATFSALSTLDAMGREPGALRMDNVHTYVRLRPGTRLADLSPNMKGFPDRHVSGEVNGFPLKRAYTFHFVPLTGIHLQPPSSGDMKPSGDVRTLKAMVVIAVLILFVAGSNFVSMMTARSARRAVEVGVRKTAGATRSQIVVQFLGECMFYTALALLFAMLAVQLALPGFNGFLQRSIAFDFFHDPALAGGLAGLLLVTGLAAGAYPAIVLSSLRPGTVLKGIAYLPGGSGRTRQILVVLQFSVLIALIIATATVHRQTQYAIEDRLNVPANQIYLGTSGCTAAVRDAVAQSPGVLAASCAAGQSVNRGRLGTVFASKDGADIAFRLSPIDYDFLPLFDIKPLAGRLFSATRGDDDLLRADPATLSNPSIVVNETGARVLGFASPEAAVGKSVRWARIISQGTQFKAADSANSQIIGVVPDSSLRSVRETIDPTAYYVDPSFFSFLVLKLDGAAIQDSLRKVNAVWAQFNPTRPLDGMFLSQHMNDLYADIMRQTTIFSAFSTVAVVLAALGLLGLAVFTAERRTREIALRKVMGALKWDILRFLAWQFARPVLLANLVAWPIAYFFMQRWLEGFAYHVGLSPLVFLLASVLALFIALATISGHALLVAGSKPAMALRYE